MLRSVNAEYWSLPDKRIAIVGAGVGGLVAAALIAARGFDVAVFEKEAAPGGKMRLVEAGGRGIDGGPTVFTLKGVFEEIFEEAGDSLSARVPLRTAEVLARHAWPDGSRLDLHADPERSRDAIAGFAGRAAGEGFAAFMREARRVFETLDTSYMRAPGASVGSLVKAAGLGGLANLARIRPFARYWDVLGEYFSDPRLRQLFGRYATYCGSSPFEAPATLMLVAHVEGMGVHLVEGGMHRFARELAALAERKGARIRYGARVARIVTQGGRVAGLDLEGGERIEADAVVLNGDVSALPQSLFGADARFAVEPMDRRERSLSALTSCFTATVEGFPLARHTVVFSADYPAEFADLAAGRLPSAPTAYLCAGDRDDAGRRTDGGSGPERIFVLVNAPPAGDGGRPEPSEIARCETATLTLLQSAGLRFLDPSPAVATGPVEFERLFPGTGGALYGRATHGWKAAFQRPGPRSKLAGLYLAGGSAHPGPGVPMAALSGRLAARTVAQDLASTRR